SRPNTQPPRHNVGRRRSSARIVDLARGTARPAEGVRAIDAPGRRWRQVLSPPDHPPASSPRAPSTVQIVDTIRPRVGRSQGKAYNPARDAAHAPRLHEVRSALPARRGPLPLHVRRSALRALRPRARGARPASGPPRAARAVALALPGRPPRGRS